MTTPLVYFLHIPKTAGTTLKAVFRREYPPRHRFDIGEDINGDIGRYRQLSATERDPLRLIQGHMSFGLHRYDSRPFTYVTMLREPISRALSDYRFVSSNTRHPLFSRVSKMSFAEYMTSGMTSQLSNGQTRLISGDCRPGDTGIPTNNDLDPAALEIAMDNLENRFSVVGLQEYFDETLLLMSASLGWGYPLYVKENVTRSGNAAPLSKADLALTAAQNALDLQLYENVKTTFQARVDRAGPAFARQLVTFRLANRLYQALRWISPGGQRRLARALLTRLRP